MPEHHTDNLERLVKIVGILVAVGTFAFGVIQFNQNEEEKREARFLEERNRVERAEAAARQPYLDRQLHLYTDAGRSAATIASAADGQARAAAEQRFWQLYWGELAMVEDGEVDAAMKQFGDALSAGASQPDLQLCSLRLAHELRASIARTWGTKLWGSPYGTEPECRYEGQMGFR